MQNIINCDNSVFIILSTLSKPPDRSRSAGNHIIITYLSISGGTNARNIVQLRQLTELFVELLHALAVAHAVGTENEEKNRVRIKILMKVSSYSCSEKGTPKILKQK